MNYLFIPFIGKVVFLLGKRWTDEEDKILREFYPTEGSGVHKRLPDRGPKDCGARGRLLGLSFEGKSRGWTEEEDRLLREYYSVGGSALVAERISRSRAAITKRALFLGLSAPRSGGNGAPAWTADELSILLNNRDKCATELTGLLPGRSVTAIDIKRVRLGLTDGISAWTPDEDEILRQYYSVEGLAIASRLPGRTVPALTQRAYTLGLHVRDMGGRGEWTEEEDAILREFWASEGSDVAKRLPGRSVRRGARRHHSRILWLRSRPMRRGRYFPMGHR